MECILSYIPISDPDRIPTAAASDGRQFSESIEVTVTALWKAVLGDVPYTKAAGHLRVLPRDIGTCSTYPGKVAPGCNVSTMQAYGGSRQARTH